MIFEESIALTENRKRKRMGMYEMEMEMEMDGVDKRLGVDEGSQMQVVLGIVIYSLMGLDDAW